jgi:hypothetical protein
MDATPAISDASPALPDTLLDGVDWPGLVLPAVGLATLAWTITGSGYGSGLRVTAGALATAVCLITGFLWMAVEHNRFRNTQEGCAQR